MEKKPVKLSELIDALEFDSPEHITKIDLETGSLVTVDQMVMSATEEGDEASLEHLPEWQKPEVEIARVIVNDSGERFLDPPDKFEFHEYRQMERLSKRLMTGRLPSNCGALLKAKEHSVISRTQPIAWV